MIVDKLLLLIVGGAEVILLKEIELELLGVELELLTDAEIELLLDLELELLDDVVEITVALTDVHGVVGLALAQAQREFAAPNTAPAEAPQALITQFRAFD